MNEDFLHFVWKFQKFSSHKLVSVNREVIRIFTTGQHNNDSGPDFFNAKISLDDQVWVGNIELHKKSSDWFAHHHDLNPEYDNVILHVVWNHDAEISRKDKTIIPTLELKNWVEKSLLNNYNNLFLKERKWINCEQEISFVEPIVLINWIERLYIERLEDSYMKLYPKLKKIQFDWEQMLFIMLCKNFGLKVNGASFESIAMSIDHKVFKKICKDRLDTEALLFGQSGLLDIFCEDTYFNSLIRRYQYLKNKFSLANVGVIKPKFFRLRPANFPTIRLSQLSVLYSNESNLFSRVMEVSEIKEYYDLFNISASEYWDTHYHFNVISKSRIKSTTNQFIDLLIINTIIPLKFSYASYKGVDISEELIELISSLKKEENHIVEKFNHIKKLAVNGLQSQALLQLKKEYCNRNRCLQCAIGNHLLKK